VPVTADLANSAKLASSRPTPAKGIGFIGKCRGVGKRDFLNDRGAGNFWHRPKWQRSLAALGRADGSVMWQNCRPCS